MIEALLEEVESKISIDMVVSRYLDKISNPRTDKSTVGESLALSSCYKRHYLNKYVSMKLSLRRALRNEDRDECFYRTHSGYTIRELEIKTESMRYEFYNATCTCYTCPKQGVPYNGRRNERVYDARTRKWIDSPNRWAARWDDPGDPPYGRAFS